MLSEQGVVGVPNVSLYLLDEPSSFLDSEQRIIASKVIKRCGTIVYSSYSRLTSA